MTRQRKLTLLWPVVAVVAVVAVLIAVTSSGGTRPGAISASSTPNLDPGTPLSGAARDFTLTDQFDRPVSLHSFRGRVVILAFNDSQCTTVCPLTTTEMVDAKRMLGPAASQVALLGVDANPQATSIKDVRAYSELHGMTRSWQFLTGSLPQLKQVWKDYRIDVAIQQGQIDHTAALFVISASGRLAKVYVTQMSYTTIEQQAQLLAREVASLLPGHPPVSSHLSYAQIPAISPTAHVALARAGGGTVALGPGSPRLLTFFATWDAEVTNLGTQLRALGRYAATAKAHGLPPLLAVDEGSVEPSPTALPRFLRGLGRGLSYPVAIDAAGRLADGYGVQDEPWMVLVSTSGQILWYYDVATSGWLSTAALVRQVRAALSHPAVPAGAAAVQAALAGSPPPLDALHHQSGRLLGGVSQLQARLRALRGYPVVMNAWASWCGPCQAEFGLFAAASARYGRQVAFLGADTEDSAGQAQAFLSEHPVSYPSYQASSRSDLSSLAQIIGLPTTIFIDRSGKVVFVHTGQYNSQGTLDQEIAAYTGVR